MYFTKETFAFLRALKKNNNRDWFQANKQRFESTVRDPILRFISDFSPKLDKINPKYVADPRPNGGSLMRIHRDIRFSDNKSPYKTELGVSFWHEDAGKSMCAPSFFMMVSAERCFAAGGLWHPDPQSLAKVRNEIANNQTAWQKVKKSKLKIEGESLSRPPRGFDPSHPFIEDIKRKDFVTIKGFSQDEMCSDSILQDFTRAYKSMSPLMEFLCHATGFNW
ncbi:MAG TPA: TIGR02453 family protein [Blastocatellia bacterium]|nr:TIGR02453 family protein [Blastocatellia bacterium]